ncbi:MAG: phytoene/squalene synthase family protein [Ferruginibacter sp.]|nr:phytoene/squalene synthase family protein [Cytophagales bacterium]
MHLHHETALKCSKLITEHYSTSFTLGIKTLSPKFHGAIYAIYGFVRCADEIVDTFHGFNQRELLECFGKDTYRAVRDRISLNPVLHSFQLVVNEYGIEDALIHAFLQSMEMDLYFSEYNASRYEEYIYGSAEVVGLMCLRVFCEGNEAMYQQLKESARRLGAAFQKVNFLRDVKSDYQERGRVYFPGVDFNAFTGDAKQRIEEDIQCDFDAAYQGILRLPRSARLGVYLAYIYYLRLFKKIRQLPVSRILSERVRVPRNQKLALLVQTYFRHQFNSL